MIRRVYGFGRQRCQHALCVTSRVAALALAFSLLAAPARADLDPVEAGLRGQLQARSAEMQALLASWVDENTGSHNLGGLERFAERLAAPFRDLGFVVEITPGAELDYPGRGPLRTGPLLSARRVARAADAPHFLLSGHYDTVFEPDSAFRGYRIDPGDSSRAIGPGVSDMKGGLVVMIYALRALAESGDLDRASFTVLIDADEELGSLGSRKAIEAAAREASYGLVFESAREAGAMVRSRRGLGQFFLTVKGVAAHAGSAHEEGRSAVLDLARKIVAIEALTEYERGVTLNVGTVHGGTKRNVVPEHAEAWIDVRYDDPQLGLDVKRRLEEIAAASHVPGTRARLWGTLHRPPKLETDAVKALLRRHAQVSADLGLRSPEPVHAGGGSDGSLMGAVGLPTLDSMGVRGGNAHTDREFVILPSLPERAAIAAILIRRLLPGPALRP